MKKMPKALVERRKRLCPNGVPKHIRVYDNGGKTYDCFSIVFTGHYRHLTNGQTAFIGASEHPFHPQGFGSFECLNFIPDYPTYGHLGKKIQFKDLPVDVKRMVKDDYMDLWNLKVKPVQY